MTADIVLHRTYLYASGTRPGRMAEAMRAGADAVILDLEDSVGLEDKAAARHAVAGFVDQQGGRPACDLHVRVNHWASGFDLDDVRAVTRPGVSALRLPKVQSATEVRDLDAVLTELEHAAALPVGTIGLYPTVESAEGAAALGAVLEATPRSRRAAFGARDFLDDISASGDPDLGTVHVRSHMAMVSRTAGCGMPIDSVHPIIDDLDGLVAGAERAKGLGFFGKSVIHPRQVEPANTVFTPDPAAVNWARQIVGSLGEAELRAAGVELDGKVISHGVIGRARAILRLSERLGLD